MSVFKWHHQECDFAIEKSTVYRFPNPEAPSYCVSLTAGAVIKLKGLHLANWVRLYILLAGFSRIILQKCSKHQCLTGNFLSDVTHSTDETRHIMLIKCFLHV